jgi:hypothetical protein
VTEIINRADDEESMTLHEREIVLEFERAIAKAMAVSDPLRVIFAPTLIAFYRALPYATYLQTAHWSDQRAAALEKSGGRCQWCEQEGTPEAPLDVHHLTYERLGEERAEDLIALCRYCHARWHRDERFPDWRPVKPLGVGGRQWQSGRWGRME